MFMKYFPINKLGFGKYNILLLFILLIPLFLYHSSLDNYFFQDDFFEINISKAQNIGEYLEFFKFRDDIIAYRPVSLQNYFFISKTIFGLNPVGFRLITFILFFASAVLITKVIYQITNNLKIGILTAAFWLTSSIHFMALTWIAAAYNIIGTFFWLLTSLIFLKFLANNRFKYYLLSLASFLLTVGSFEFSVTWPVIFGFYCFYVLNFRINRLIKTFAPFLIVSITYVVLRLLLIKVPQIPEYQIALNTESIKSLFWYFFWTLNIPEEFKKQVVTNLIIFNPKFLIDFWPLVMKSFVGTLWLLFVACVIPIYLIFKQKIKIGFRFIFWAMAWFGVGISPVLLLPNHTFSMYLTLASIGFYAVLAYLLVRAHQAILIFATMIIWLVISTTTVSFNKANSWMINAQKTSEAFAVGIKRQYPHLPSNSIVFYDRESTIDIQPLMQNHALRAIYNDQTLSIYYNKKDLLNALKGNDSKAVYLYRPE